MAVDYASLIYQMAIWGMVTFVVGGIIIVFVAVLMYVARTFRYKVKLDIYEKVGGHYLSYGREALEVINKQTAGTGKRVTHLLLRVAFKGTKKIPLPDSATFIPHGTMLTTKKKLNLLYTNGLFAPLNVVENSPAALTFNVEDVLTVLQSWDQDFAENLETHKPKASFWDKYQQFITILSVLSMTMIFWILIFVITRQGGPTQVIG